jgi:hypothetical protein
MTKRRWVNAIIDTRLLKADYFVGLHMGIANEDFYDALLVMTVDGEETAGSNFRQTK